MNNFRNQMFMHTALCSLLWGENQPLRTTAEHRVPLWGSKVKGVLLVNGRCKRCMISLFGLGKELSHMLLSGDFSFLKGDACYFTSGFANLICPLLRVNTHLVSKIALCYTSHRLWTQMNNQPIKKHPNQQDPCDFPLMVVSFNQNFVTLML